MGQTEKVNIIGGKLYYMLFLAGASKILEQQNFLNKINVFPVPDADTGTNLASTLRAIIENAQPSPSFTKTADAIAIAALNGARGNSGVIFAQFLYGMSKEAGTAENLSIQNFAEIIKRSVKYIYEALAEPVEGTMLTVIREWADYIYSQKDKVDDLIYLFLKAYEIALKSLNETTSKLKALQLANVVDAGAKGFVLFLEGIIEGLRKRDRKRSITLQSAISGSESFTAIPHENFNYRFCCEGLLKAGNIDKLQLKTNMKPFGDSLVLAGSEQMVRFHLHTNTPDKLFEAISAFGTISFQKVDDMKKQNDINSERKWNIALVTDSTSDLPPEIIDNYQIHQIPLNIHFGENQYLDKLTISPTRFFELVENEKKHPTTSQPNENSFLALYSHLASHYDSVISVHLTDKFSGTLNSSMKAAERISKETGKKITVLDSGQVSGSLGLLTYKTARAIENGMSHEHIIENFSHWKENARIFVSVKNLKYMIRGGRVSPLKGNIARMLNAKPIVSMDRNGGSALFDRAFTQRSNMKKVMKHVRNILKEKELWDYIILHAEGEETAKWFEEQMMLLTGKKPLTFMNISTVIGLSAGKGTAAIALMTK